jgi:type II secretory ATPase GspE/PulE/Tfp pilus assembly ATPase PilB-like protein
MSVPALRDLGAAARGPLAQRLSPKYLEEHCLLPVAIGDDGVLVVAAGTALDPVVRDELRRAYGRPIRTVEAPAAEIHAAVMSTAGDTTDTAGIDPPGIDDLPAMAAQAPVIKLVNVILLEALRVRASDVHLESSAHGLRVRYRIDGVLQDVSTPPRQYHAAIVSRIKIMADLNIAERRTAQDGRIRLPLSDRELDLRVSTLPTLHGESVVLRILDHSAGGGARELPALAMPSAVERTFRTLIRSPHGIVLVTGPTGSGKTTTLYAALRQINAPGTKLITVEDPVEYQVEGVTQIPVNTKAGLTFATALRSILRHDPDVIMVGEMRDPETAQIAIQAALTGHTVFSTLHTNDAPGAITRLVDMGIPPYLIAATVLGVLAQRLVRVICPSCVESADAPPADVLRTMPPVPAGRQPMFRVGRGCDACAGTGYRGRQGIYELMPMRDRMRAAVAAGAPLAELRALARVDGLVSLHHAGWALVVDGVTTVSELLRVTEDVT